MNLRSYKILKRVKLGLFLHSLLTLCSAAGAAEPPSITVTRLGDGPIITPEMDDRM